MRLNASRGNRPVAAARALAYGIVAACLAVLASGLVSPNEAVAGEPASDSASHHRPAGGDEDRLSGLVRDLLDGKTVECERIIGTLLGIDEVERIDCTRILGLLFGLEAGEDVDNERIVRLLLGIDDADEIDREQIDRLLSSRGRAESADPE